MLRLDTRNPAIARGLCPNLSTNGPTINCTITLVRNSARVRLPISTLVISRSFFNSSEIDPIMIKAMPTQNTAISDTIDVILVALGSITLSPIT